MWNTVEDQIKNIFDAGYERRPLTAAQKTLDAIARIKRMARDENERKQREVKR